MKTRRRAFLMRCTGICRQIQPDGCHQFRARRQEPRSSRRQTRGKDRPWARSLALALALSRSPPASSSAALKHASCGVGYQDLIHGARSAHAAKSASVAAIIVDETTGAETRYERKFVLLSEGGPTRFCQLIGYCPRNPPFPSPASTPRAPTPTR
jgi:hypothetical protein